MLSEMSTERLEGSDPSSASAINSNVNRKRTYDESSKNEKNPNSIVSTVGLPRELTDKFGPLHCKLCNITASSNVSAKVHYAGKPHRKSIKKFLDEWCKKTGEPMPKLSKPEETQMRQDVTYCNICKLVLTSVSNAQEHYAGKNHFKAVRRSYTNIPVDGKPVPKAAADPTGRFGIGVAFLKPEENPQPQEPQPKVELKPDKKNLWICELCNVRTHTEEQLKIHLGGSKHIKAVKRSQAPSVVPAPVNPSESILASVIRPESGGTDYSMHRTPSGNYYCQCCNVTLNSSEQFGQHIESKKHKFKYASLRKPMNRNDKVPT